MRKRVISVVGMVASLALGVIAAAALGAGSAGATETVGRPVFAVPTCSAANLNATYTMVPESNATGHVEYLLTMTNHSTSKTCAVTAPLRLRLLGTHGRLLATKVRNSPKRAYTVVLAPGQWAQATSLLSPDLPGPGEPTRGNCEPLARSVRITIGHGSVRAAMDPTPVCEHGAIFFNRLAAVHKTPACSAGSLAPAFKRDSPPFDGFAEYSLTLRNRTAQDCHADSILGLRLLGTGEAKLPTRVRAGISSPYVVRAHATATAVARLATERPAGSSRGCDALATGLAIAPARGAATLSTAIRPAVRVCQHGLIGLSGLFLNG